MPVLIIVNAYDPDVVHRVEIPGKPDKLCDSFITRTNDLFFVVRARRTMTDAKDKDNVQS